MIISEELKFKMLFDLFRDRLPTKMKENFDLENAIAEADLALDAFLKGNYVLTEKDAKSALENMLKALEAKKIQPPTPQRATN